MMPEYRDLVAPNASYEIGVRKKIHFTVLNLPETIVFHVRTKYKIF